MLRAVSPVGPGADGVWDVGAGVTAPQRISGEPAPYPDVAQRADLEGAVTVEMIVTEDGSPEDLEVTESAGPILDRAVVEAVRGWRFEPAQRNGEPVRVRWCVRQQFRLAQLVRVRRARARYGGESRYDRRDAAFEPGRRGPPVSRSGYPRIATLGTPEAFRTHLESQGIRLDFDEKLDPGPLARPLEADGVRVGNRFCILPMEGWDGTRDGAPTDLTRRRWRRFGVSGAKLIWGGEAVAVRADGRANPNQLLLDERTLPALRDLRQELVSAHCERFGAGADEDLLVGLQLTHSGRFSRPRRGGPPTPLAAYAHPWLDRRFEGDVPVLDDDALQELVNDFVLAAQRARAAGFDFVDLKHCHGYLGHELLSARDRPGRFGGSFDNRTRFLREVVSGIRAEVPGLRIGVRFSAFDTVPYRKGPDGWGEPEVDPRGYRWAFGLLEDERLDPALGEARKLLSLLEQLGVRWVCTTAGSPYYNPHVQRPAMFPPSDGYGPPEDPLAGVARQIEATARLKADFPGIVFVGSAYSYLQEWLPHVAQRVVREERADFVGLGRMALTYPELPVHVLGGEKLRRKLVCRTFSDCTSAPRAGLVSGCYPLDRFYAEHPDAEKLAAFKASLRGEAQ